MKKKAGKAAEAARKLGSQRGFDVAMQSAVIEEERESEVSPRESQSPRFTGCTSIADSMASASNVELNCAESSSSLGSPSRK